MAVDADHGSLDRVGKPLRTKEFYRKQSAIGDIKMNAALDVADDMMEGGVVTLDDSPENDFLVKQQWLTNNDLLELFGYDAKTDTWVDLNEPVRHEDITKVEYLADDLPEFIQSSGHIITNVPEVMTTTNEGFMVVKYTSNVSATDDEPDLDEASRVARERYYWVKYFEERGEEDGGHKLYLPGGPDAWTDRAEWSHYMDEQWETHMALVNDHPTILYNATKQVFGLWRTSLMPAGSTAEDVQHEAFGRIVDTLLKDFIDPRDKQGNSLAPKPITAALLFTAVKCDIKDERNKWNTKNAPDNKDPWKLAKDRYKAERDAANAAGRAHDYVPDTATEGLKTSLRFSVVGKRDRVPLNGEESKKTTGAANVTADVRDQCDPFDHYEAWAHVRHLAMRVIFKHYIQVDKWFKKDKRGMIFLWYFCEDLPLGTIAGRTQFKTDKVEYIKNEALREFKKRCASDKDLRDLAGVAMGHIAENDPVASYFEGVVADAIAFNRPLPTAADLESFWFL